MADRSNKAGAGQHLCHCGSLERDLTGGRGHLCDDGDQHSDGGASCSKDQQTRRVVSEEPSRDEGVANPPNPKKRLSRLYIPAVVMDSTWMSGKVRYRRSSMRRLRYRAGR